MARLKISVGGSMEQEATQRFLDAWHRAERGETFQQRHLSFESWAALARLLTDERLELLRYVRRHPTGADARAIRGLARALGREYSEVQADVRALTDSGLLERSSNGLQADYDAIETSISV